MSATTDPIPVRALNQVTYCQRLYYLQYVDAVMPTNQHVEGGLHDHRRVDAADLKNKTRNDRGTATSRGIALSSEALGITGVLDVIEEKNGEQYPVETKHGPAPHDDDGSPTVWDNDAVQLCAQALLMEEAFGKDGTAPKPTNARAKKVATRKPLEQLPVEFAELWERIKHKTRYQVEVNTEKLVTDVVAALDKLKIEPPRIISQTNVRFIRPVVCDACSSGCYYELPVAQVSSFQLGRSHFE